MNKALLDTDIFSEVLKKKSAAVLARARDHLLHQPQLTVSALTVTEIVAGYRQAQRQSQLQSFLAALSVNEVLSFGPDEGRLAGEFLANSAAAARRSAISTRVIASIAIAHRLTLVTGNTDHFQRIQDLGYALLPDNWRLAPTT